MRAATRAAPTTTTTTTTDNEGRPQGPPRQQRRQTMKGGHEGRPDNNNDNNSKNNNKKYKMNKYDPNIHHRRSIRLKGYDYAQAGLYFITICVQNRECMFGEIIDGKMILNDAGKMIENEWINLKKRYENIELHEFITMPNHFHGILEIVVGAAPTVGDMMGAFKSISTVEYIRGVKNLNWQPFNGKLWQRDYYEHIIRDERAYENISNYIVNNPAKWAADKFYG